MRGIRKRHLPTVGFASRTFSQRRISLANCIRKESGGLGRNKSGDIGRVIVKSLRADAYMYNRTLRNEKDVKFDARARTYALRLLQTVPTSVPVQQGAHANARARAITHGDLRARRSSHATHARSSAPTQTANPRLDPRLQHTSGWRRSRRGCVLHARAASPDRLRASEARPYHYYPRQRRRSDRRRR